MKIYLRGSNGGIGSAIKEVLNEHEFVEHPNQHADWLIFAHGIIKEDSPSSTFEINTALPITETEYSLPFIKKGVIYISSTAGIKGNDKFPVYSASKAALNSYTQTMARKRPNLQFYAICPGPTDTKMWRELKLEGKAQPPIAVAKAVQRVMNGEFKSGDIIVVRDGKIL